MSLETETEVEIELELEEIIDLEREYTLEEYVALPDDGNTYELIEGKLVMRPVTRDRHGRVMSRLYDAMRDFLKTKPVGEVWLTTGFNLGKKPNGKDNVLGPDLGFIIASRVPPEANEYLPYPDLAIEVWSRDSDLASPSKLAKARKKLQIYLAAGTTLAWGINPKNKTVEIYRQGQAPKILNGSAELEGEELLPGFKINLTDLFK